jgi:hypothetical protein
VRGAGPSWVYLDGSSVAIGIAGSGAPGRSLFRNAMVARLARFGGAAPLSLGDSERTV